MDESRFPFIMTLDEFREKTKDISGDAVLVVEMDTEFEFTELQLAHIIPATETKPTVLWLTGSQVVNQELNMDERVDKYFK
jgi:hypothetical protein